MKRYYTGTFLFLILPALFLLVAPSFAAAGTQNYTSPGTYTFTVPTYAALTVTVNGAGGGGGGAAGVYSYDCGKGCTAYAGIPGVSNGSTGGNSSFNSNVVGNGGGGGALAPGTSSAGASGSSGTASGGDTNTTGGGAGGGTGPNNCNGSGGVTLGAAGAGGTGGQAVKTYSSGTLTPGASITVVVGSGAGGGTGAGPSQGANVCYGNNGGTGTSGAVLISWTSWTQNYTSPGTYTFTVPTYAALTVTVNGAGGGGGGAAGVYSHDCGKGCTAYAGIPGVSNGSTGGNSSFNSNVVGNGGGGGGKSPGTTPGEQGCACGAAGSSGTASGGDTNTTGGGAGGGTGPNNCNGNSGVTLGAAGAGGAGGQAVKTYSSGALTPGAGITVVVGSGAGGGTGGSSIQGGTTVCIGNNGGTGTNSSVLISWTSPTPGTTFTKPVSITGNLSVTLDVTKSAGSFVIDHPLDPQNKLLFHSFVESPDAKNIYDGLATLGKSGEATVVLPSYFDALNKDARYQLKPLGAPMPELFVKEEEHDNHFVIGGGVPGGEVSWQVTGIRHDPYILANPIIPEVEKGPDQLVDKGEYLFPEGYVPEDLGGSLEDFVNIFMETVRRFMQQTTLIPSSAFATTITQSSTVTGGASVLGTLSKGSGSFVIDDPLDPKNKLLYHSFVESPDVMNIYDGIAMLNKNGEVTIELPAYFLALNKDFRYLATPVGEPMPNLHLSKEIRPRWFGLFGTPVFKVSGGVANGKVSWQVTGIRHDPYILANPIVPVVDKGPGQVVEQGQYICTECYK